MVNQVVQTTEKLQPSVETIFHWRKDDDSHCLLRIYIDEQNECAIVTASILQSNDMMPEDVSTDFEALAMAVQAKFPSVLDPKHINNVTWICHSGLFSVANSYENLTTPERFSRVALPWPFPDQLAPWSGQWRVLRPAEVEELKNKIELRPVTDILENRASDI